MTITTAWINSAMTLDIFTGGAFVLAGAMLLLRQILLSPATRTFPCAPLVVRIAMFGAGVFTVWFGVQFLGRRPSDLPFAGPSAHAMAVLAAGVLTYHFVLLMNAFRERRPPKVWLARARIDARSGFDTADVRRFLESAQEAPRTHRSFAR